MLLSLPLLPLSTVAIADDTTSVVGWTLALFSFLLYGIGTLTSGAPYLGLVHDSAPYDRRGQAMAIVQFILVVSFAFVPALYAWLMPEYDEAAFLRLVLVGMAGAAVFWLVSVWGEERRDFVSRDAQAGPSFRSTFAELWANLQTRRYALFLGASAFFAFMQDAVLEPFGGDVFGLAAGETTRFNVYWGIGVMVGMIGTLFLTRRRRPDQQVGTTTLGLIILGSGLFLLGVIAVREMLSAIMPVLVVFGLGFGIFTVGGVSLLMAMCADEQAASYLALWSVVQLVSRGAGIAAGGLIRDVALSLSSEYSVAYASVFLIASLGVLLSIALLRRADVGGFAQQHSQVATTDTLVALTD
jgi:BCD family chlorophyll transporter-like MFS transporter